MKRNHEFKIALIQKTARESHEKSLDESKEFAKSAFENENADIVCLNEFFYCTYFPKYKGDNKNRHRAASFADDVIREFSELCQEFKKYAFIPFIEKEKKNGEIHYYSSCTLINPDGKEQGKRYRKIHVPERSTSELGEYYEKDYFSEGNSGYFVYDLEEYCRIGVLLCYDRHFPEAYRKLAILGAKMILIPVCTAYKDNNLYNKLTSGNVNQPSPFLGQTVQGQANCNGIYVAVVNKTGQEDEMFFYGNSFICGPDGQIIGDTMGKDEGYQTWSLDISECSKASSKVDWKASRSKKMDTNIPVNNVFDYVLEGGNVFYEGEIRENWNIGINEDEIEIVTRHKIKSEKKHKIIHCKNKYIIPGLIDSHVHCYHGSKDDYYSISKAALHGGVTTIIDYIVTDKNSTNDPGGKLIDEIIRRKKQAKENSTVGISFHIAIRLKEHLDKIPELIKDGNLSFKIFLNKDDIWYNDNGTYNDDMLGILLEILPPDTVLSIHAEDKSIIDDLKKKQRKKKEKTDTFDLYKNIYSKEAEIKAVKKILALCDKLKNVIDLPVLYFCHISTKEGIEEITKYKNKYKDENSNKNPKIYVETCPHYLIFDEEKYKTKRSKNNLNWIVEPPLRSANDCKALWKAFKNGNIDVIASDHCAVERSSSDIDPGKPKGGIPGTQFLFHMIYTKAKEDGMDEKNAIKNIVQTMCINPSKIFNLDRCGEITPGNLANLIILSLGTKLPVNKVSPMSNIKLIPWQGFFKSKIEQVFIHGLNALLNQKINNELYSHETIITRHPAKDIESSEEAIIGPCIILWCDLSQSTKKILEQEYHGIKRMVKFHKLIYKSIKKYDGLVLKSIGDEIIAYFEYKKGMENNGYSALISALNAAIEFNFHASQEENKIDLNAKITLTYLENSHYFNFKDYSEHLSKHLHFGARLHSLSKPKHIIIDKSCYKILEKNVDKDGHLGELYIEDWKINIKKPVCFKIRKLREYNNIEVYAIPWIIEGQELNIDGKIEINRPARDYFVLAHFEGDFWVNGNEAKEEIGRLFCENNVANNYKENHEKKYKSLPNFSHDVKYCGNVTFGKGVLFKDKEVNSLFRFRFNNLEEYTVFITDTILKTLEDLKMTFTIIVLPAHLLTNKEVLDSHEYLGRNEFDFASEMSRVIVLMQVKKGNKDIYEYFKKIIINSNYKLKSKKTGHEIRILEFGLIFGFAEFVAVFDSESIGKTKVDNERKLWEDIIDELFGFKNNKEIEGFRRYVGRIERNRFLLSKTPSMF
ncbi:nitrilase-related carbon-nitrogen hydrolase [candidate division KSB1 bacterium]